MEISMIIKDIERCSHFKAMDETILCELLHPAREGLDLHYSIAHAMLEPGMRSLPHRLKESSEVYYILEGQGLMHIDAETSQVMPGQAVYIPPGAWQHIENTGVTDLKFLCIVYPMWRAGDEELR
ncbi:MAG TPA: cupin domain-containing protein [Methanotrichaceae archaeon]|nr:cupin domain-containing protein [Methanotrichaceae archaeon]